MKIDGSCHCQAIAYEAEVQSGSITVCHCNDCQAQSGSVFRANIPAPADGFRLVRGTPRTYLKTADSGRQRLLAFREVCGTTLYACDVDRPVAYSLRVGTIRQRQQLGTPQRQIWTRRRHAWVSLPAGMESCDGQP